MMRQIGPARSWRQPCDQSRGHHPLPRENAEGTGCSFRDSRFDPESRIRRNRAGVSAVAGMSRALAGPRGGIVQACFGERERARCSWMAVPRQGIDSVEKKRLSARRVLRVPHEVHTINPPIYPSIDPRTISSVHLVSFILPRHTDRSGGPEEHNARDALAFSPLLCSWPPKHPTPRVCRVPSGLLLS